MEKEFQNQKFQEEERENTTASGDIELENPGALNRSEFDMEKMVREFRAFQNAIIQQHQEQMKSFMEEIEQMFLSQQYSNNQKGDKEQKESLVVEAGKDDLSTQLASAREGHDAVQLKQIPCLEVDIVKLFPPASPHFEERKEEEESALSNEALGEERMDSRTEGPNMFGGCGEDEYDNVSRGKEWIEEVGKAVQSSLVPPPEGYCLAEIQSKPTMAVRMEDNESERTMEPTLILSDVNDGGLHRWTMNAVWRMKPADKGGGIGEKDWTKKWSRFLEAVT